MYKFELYITIPTNNTSSVVNRLRSILKEEFDKRYTLAIISVLDQPELAEAEGILATPTLVKKEPQPKRKIIGDLINREKILLGLDLLT